MLFFSTFFQGQRTVYRLTLVKGWNVEEIKAYRDLIELGKPDFIEVKVSLRSSCIDRLLVYIVVNRRYISSPVVVHGRYK